MARKIISIVLSVGLLFQQGGLVYAAGEFNLANYLSQARNAIVQPDVFQPARLRYISYDMASNDLKILLDKGNNVNRKTEKTLPAGRQAKNQKTLEFLNSLTPKLLNSKTPELNESTQELFNYFLIGLALPNDTFWVNLRPDAPENIIDPLLEKTDIGKIFLEADLQLKKDTASLTSPQNPEGKLYWDKLYKKAGELFGTENITIPTITRPWIVPNEVIVRETEDSAYIYKATLKVMLEADYLNGRGGSRTAPTPDQYAFSDPRLKELNEYSSQIIRETIIPKLTKEVNSSKRYAKLRQVYYSLVLSRWFKQKYSSFGSARAQGTSAPANSYLSLINSGNLVNLTSQEPGDKQAYFQAYQKSFKDGEYNLKETVATPFGQSIRSYISGGIRMSASPVMGGSFYKKGKDFLRKYITKLNSVMYTFMDDMDDAGVVRRFALTGDSENTDIDAYIALKGMFLTNKALTVEKLDRLIEMFRNADATLFFEGKKDFLTSIAIILERCKKNGVYNPMEIRDELRPKLENLVMVYGNEMRILINHDTLKSFFEKNYDFKKQLTRFLDKNKVIQAAELIYAKSDDLYHTNTIAARDLVFVVGESVLKIGGILNSEKPISIASPLEVKQVVKALKEIHKGLKDINAIVIYLSQPENGYNSNIQEVSNSLGQVMSVLHKKINNLGQMRTEIISIEDISYFGKLKNDLRGIKSAINKFVEINSVKNNSGDINDSIKNKFENLSAGIENVLKQAEGLYKELQGSAGSPLTSNKIKELADIVRKTILKYKNEFNRIYESLSVQDRQSLDEIDKLLNDDGQNYLESLRSAAIKLSGMFFSRFTNQDPNSVLGKEAKEIEDGYLIIKRAEGAIDFLIKEAGAGSPLGEPLFVNDKEVGRYVRLEDLRETMTDEAILKLVNDTIFLEDGPFGVTEKSLTLQSLDYLKNARMAIIKNDDGKFLLLGIAQLSSTRMGEINELMGVSKEIRDALRSAWEVEKGGRFSNSPLMGVRLSPETLDNWRLVRYGNLSEPVKASLYKSAQNAFPDIKLKLPEFNENDVFVVELNDSLGIGRVLGAWISGMQNGTYVLKQLDSYPKRIITNTLNDLMTGKKSAGSPVKEIYALNENYSKIALMYGKLADFDPYWQNVIKKKLKGGLAFPISGGDSGKYLLSNDLGHINEMRFAVMMTLPDIKIKGILITSSKKDEMGLPEDFMADSQDIGKVLRQTWGEEISASPAQAKEIVSSSLEKRMGGIDLTDRALHIKLERVGSFASTPLLLPQVKNVQDLDLDKEFAQVEALASSGIVPNSHRLLELFTVCHYRGEFGERLNQIISCLKSSSAIQEAQAIDSDEDFRLALMMPEMLS